MRIGIQSILKQLPIGCSRLLSIEDCWRFFASPPRIAQNDEGRGRSYLWFTSRMVSRKTSPAMVRLFALSLSMVSSTVW